MNSMAAFRRVLILLSGCVSLLLVYNILRASSSGSSLTVTEMLDLSKVGDKLKTWPFTSAPPSPEKAPAGNLTTADHESSPSAAAGSLEALCRQTAWRPNLAFHCSSRCGPDQTSICGGLNNARDRLQTCVRLAIDAGATALVVPSLAARSELRLATVDPSRVPGEEEAAAVVLCPDAWFSVAALRRALAASCPRLRVEAACPAGASSVAGLAGVPEGSVVELPWRPLGGDRYAAVAGQRFRDAVDAALGPARAEKLDAPVLVEYGDPYVAWNYALGGEAHTVFKDLFRAVEYSPDLLDLGRRITDSPRLRDAPYWVGVHLRAEDDWPPAWGSAEEQTQAYVDELRRVLAREGEGEGQRGERGSRSPPGGPPAAVYVSCGNRTAIQRFREAVAPLGFAVVDKWTVLEESWPEGLAEVEALGFDAKAVVEYVPLTTARYFLGLRSSSMSVVVTWARTLEEEGEFFENYVDAFEEETKDKGRILEMRGNNNTKLLAISNIEW